MSGLVRSLLLLFLLLAASPLKAADQVAPDWILRGALQALSDETAGTAAAALPILKVLAPTLPPGPEADRIARQVLKMLRDPALVADAAEALAHFPEGEWRASAIEAMLGRMRETQNHTERLRFLTVLGTVDLPASTLSVVSETILPFLAADQAPDLRAKAAVVLARLVDSSPHVDLWAQLLAVIKEPMLWMRGADAMQAVAFNLSRHHALEVVIALVHLQSTEGGLPLRPANLSDALENAVLQAPKAALVEELLRIMRDGTSGEKLAVLRSMSRVVIPESKHDEFYRLTAPLLRSDYREMPEAAAALLADMPHKKRDEALESLLGRVGYTEAPFRADIMRLFRKIAVGGAHSDGYLPERFVDDLLSYARDTQSDLREEALKTLAVDNSGSERSRIFHDLLNAWGDRNLEMSEVYLNALSINYDGNYCPDFVWSRHDIREIFKNEISIEILIDILNKISQDECQHKIYKELLEIFRIYKYKEAAIILLRWAKVEFLRDNIIEIIEISNGIFSIRDNYNLIVFFSRKFSEIYHLRGLNYSEWAKIYDPIMADFHTALGYALMRDETGSLIRSLLATNLSRLNQNARRDIIFALAKSDSIRHTDIISPFLIESIRLSEEKELLIGISVLAKFARPKDLTEVLNLLDSVTEKESNFFRLSVFEIYRKILDIDNANLIVRRTRDILNSTNRLHRSRVYKDGTDADETQRSIEEENILHGNAWLFLSEVPSGEWSQQIVKDLMDDGLGSVDESGLEPEIALKVLLVHGPGHAVSSLAALRASHATAPWNIASIRMAAHLAAGGDPEAEVLLAWLGRVEPDRLPLASVRRDPAQAHSVLSIFLKHWDDVSASRSLREEAEARVMDVVYAACGVRAALSDLGLWGRISFTLEALVGRAIPRPRCWTPDQLETLRKLYAAFHVGSAHRVALAQHIQEQSPSDGLESALPWLIPGWILFWVTFLFVFPWSRTVQAIFFWNPRVRGMVSLGAVPLMLHLPPLRRHLLRPFREKLLEEARLEALPDLGFFGDVRVRHGDGPARTITDVLPGLSGAVVLRGDAGLGKTSILRQLASQQRRPVVFLQARDCADGVEAAVLDHIGRIQEEGFVRGAIHTGGLLVLIDGLNEVSVEIRMKISDLLKRRIRGDIVVATQPIEWEPPAGVRVYDLLPLDREATRRFLVSRPVAADPTHLVHGPAFETAVDCFITGALDQAPGEGEREAAKIILSNPFDLTLAADLLARGHMPAATGLIDAAFRLADEGGPGEPGYRAKAGVPFPLVAFGRHAVQMRLEDRNWFQPGEFEAEQPCLIHQRMLVQRSVMAWRGREGEAPERVIFRHDRIWDFFMAAAFEADADLVEAHLGDPRFRGVYLRIAETWPPEKAMVVRDALVQVAAERNEHAVSDAVVMRLKARLGAVKPA